MLLLLSVSLSYNDDSKFPSYNNAVNRTAKIERERREGERKRRRKKKRERKRERGREERCTGR